MPAVKRTPAMEMVWRMHRWVYRVSGGRVGGTMMGMPVLLLTTVATAQEWLPIATRSPTSSGCSRLRCPVAITSSPRRSSQR